MNKLIEIRNQELMCRERALVDTERSEFWLAEAEEWGQRALDEIASHFGADDCASFMGATKTASNDGARV